jgi:hypothetical protein
MDKGIPRKCWAVDETRVNEDNAKILSTDELNLAFKAQGHIPT